MIGVPKKRQKLVHTVAASWAKSCRICIYNHMHAFGVPRSIEAHEAHVLVVPVFKNLRCIKMLQLTQLETLCSTKSLHSCCRVAISCHQLSIA